MRLFVGIAIPEDVVACLRALVETLRPLAALKWSRFVDLHVTTKFIGEAAPARVADIQRALGALPPRAPFRVTLRGLGWFPDGRAPRVFWAGVDAEPDLTDLAVDTERALTTVGVPADGRAYTPHLTLARVPSGAGLDALRRALGALPSTDFGAFVADRFILYESRTSDGLAHYRALATLPLASPPRGGALQ